MTLTGDDLVVVGLIALGVIVLIAALSDLLDWATKWRH